MKLPFKSKHWITGLYHQYSALSAAFMKGLLQILAIAVLLLTGCGSPKAASHRSDLPLRYHNAQYGFTFRLPASWEGYSVRIEQWKGTSYVPAKDALEVTAQGPLILLRHPQWRADAPTQDIPILVYTRSQWESGTAENAFPYAGGIIDELWHNEHYVFAIHSRFDWGELKGWQEAANVVAQNCALNDMPPLLGKH